VHLRRKLSGDDTLASTMSHIEDVTVGIVKRSDAARGFVVLRKHWVVERSFRWVG
jgi:transposase